MDERAEPTLQADLENEFSPLRCAISNDRVSELLPFVENDPGVLELCTAHKRQNLLHLAVSNGSLSIIRLAAKWKGNRAFVEHTNCWHETVLHLAAASGDAQLLRALFPLEIDQSVRDQWGRTAADIAVQMEHHALLGEDLLSRRFFTPPPDASHSTSTPHLPPHPSSFLVTDLKKALQLRAAPTEPHRSRQLPDPTRGRPVTTVVKSIFADSTRLEPSSSSAAPPVQDHVASSAALHRSVQPVARKTALSKVIEFPGDANFLQAVLHSQDCSYDINGKDMFGLTALHKFAAWNKVELLDMLLAQDSIEVNVSGGKIGTPLHAAADMAALAAVSRLLQDPRLDRNALDSCGRTAAEVARQKGYVEIETLLVS